MPRKRQGQAARIDSPTRLTEKGLSKIPILVQAAQTAKESILHGLRQSARRTALFADYFAFMNFDLKTLRFCASANDAPSAPGAYILWIDLGAEAAVKIAGRSPLRLPAGRYLYCGSAHGPGGLKSRLARHMRHGKSVHWHIDQLTERGVVAGSWIACNGRECDLVAMLAPLPMPIPGFGSSDCRRCRSHLLSWPISWPISWPMSWPTGRHLDVLLSSSACSRPIFRST